MNNLFSHNNQTQTNHSGNHQTHDQQNSSKNSQQESQNFHQKDNQQVDLKDQAKLSDLARQNAELIGDLQRTRADFENYRKQVEAQKEQAKIVAKHATVSKFLPLIDDRSRAVKAHPDLLTPVQKTLNKTLKSLNLEVIDSKVGTLFNPEFHNAISMEDDDGDKEVIAEELIPGYLYEGNVLRAAMVRVKHQ